MIQGLLAIITLSIIDYLGYNNWGHLYTNQYINTYRVFIVIIQIFISVILFHFFSIFPTIVFLWFWWIGIADFLYYVIDVIKGGNEQFFLWQDKATMSWLWFTPYGLLKRFVQKKDITKQEFIIQITLGLFIALFINLT